MSGSRQTTAGPHHEGGVPEVLSLLLMVTSPAGSKDLCFSARGTIPSAILCVRITESLFFIYVAQAVGSVQRPRYVLLCYRQKSSCRLH
ncbi:hypothetical protein SSAG_03082 [Streptomyces sp. Mg1]|nr:hypothetical protein SSAG_03082 [Streptomyces sp. Mg1]